MDASNTKTLSKWVTPAATIGYILGIALLSCYVGLRLNRWIFLAFRWDTTWLITFLMGSFFCASMVVGKKYLVAGGPIRTWLCGVSTFVMIWLGIAFLATDVFCRLTRQTGLEDIRRTGWWVVLFVLVLSVLSFHHRKAIRVRKIPLPLVEGRCRMVLLSDLHIGYYVGKRHMAQIVRRVNALKPDVVVISGDLINAGNTAECRQLPQVALLLHKIDAPVYAVTGNHDPDASDETFRTFLKTANVRLLDDEVETCDQYHLVGRSTCTKPRKPLTELLPDRSRPVIVLDHDPQGIREAIDAKADLVLCGHTHRGQVFPLNLFVRLVYSAQQVYGLSTVDSTTAYVTAGAGYFSMPMRLGSTCEIVSFDLGTAPPVEPEQAPEQVPEQPAQEEAEPVPPSAEPSQT